MARTRFFPWCKNLQRDARHALKHSLRFRLVVMFLLLGYPVAFALAANGLLFGVVGIELGLFAPTFFQALSNRLYGVMENDVLLAIPFFTFMGLILERSESGLGIFTTHSIGKEQLGLG